MNDPRILVIASRASGEQPDPAGVIRLIERLTQFGPVTLSPPIAFPQGPGHPDRYGHRIMFDASRVRDTTVHGAGFTAGFIVRLDNVAPGDGTGWVGFARAGATA